MLQITASARRIRRRNQVGLILVDYIQLVDSEDSRDSRQEQIAKISRRLKALARDAGSSGDRPVPVEPGRREPRRQDALGWPTCESRAPSSRMPTSSCCCIALIITSQRPARRRRADVAKNRNGATGDSSSLS